MRHDIALRRARVVNLKHGMESLMQALKEAEIKKESIPVHMYQGQTAIQQLTDNDETTTLMVHTGNINETTTLCIPKEEEWIHRVFYLVRSKHQFNPKSLGTRGM